MEHGLLLLARSCGLQVAESRLTRVGDADVLLVKRFDRDWSEGGYRRHRMISALTLLQAEDSATDRAKDTNQHLAACGLQIRNPRGEWELTNAGLQWAEALPYCGGGHSGYQILWNPAVAEQLREVA